MTTSETKTNGRGQFGSWLRRCHRWLGAIVILFLLLLSFTGIALNHSRDWGLDDRYLTSPWLLDAYGVRAPQASSSFADGGHRVTLLGHRLYLDDREIADDIEALTGMLSLNELLLLTSHNAAFLFTTDGQMVERMDLTAMLPAPIDRIGRAGGHAIVASAGRTYRSNTEITEFEPWPESEVGDIDWSDPAAVPESLLDSLQTQYRGQGLSIERLVSDVHSGRVVTKIGPLLMDMVAVLLILLCLSGTVIWMRPRRNSAEATQKQAHRAGHREASTPLTRQS